MSEGRKIAAILVAGIVGCSRRTGAPRRAGIHLGTRPQTAVPPQSPPSHGEVVR